jgi:hypothetical protein
MPLSPKISPGIGFNESSKESPYAESFLFEFSSGLYMILGDLLPAPNTNFD